MIAEAYRYYRGGKDCYEAVELDEVRSDGMYITSCVVNVSLLLCGIWVHPCGNGESLELDPELRLKVLEFVQAERKKITDSYPIKTYEGWLNSGLRTFEEYCFPGDEVDEAVVDHFVNSVPPVTLRSSCTQAGEPYSTEPDGHGNCGNTYTTFHSIGEGRWVYDGLCFKNSNENRVIKPYSQCKLEQLIEEARREAEKNDEN